MKKKQNDFLLVCFQKEENIYENKEKNIKIEIEEIVKKNTIKGKDKEIKQEFTKNILKDNEKNKELLQINLQKYALFKITKNDDETIYLYCSNIESTTNNGMFENCNSIENVFVVIGDGKNIENISKMFYNCNNLNYIHFEYLLADIDKLNCDQIFEKCKNLSNIIFIWKEQDKNQQHPLYVYLSDKKEFYPHTCYNGGDNNYKISNFLKYDSPDGVDFCISCWRLCCPCFI